MKQSLTTIGIAFSTLTAGLAIGISVTQWLVDKDDSAYESLRRENSNLNKRVGEIQSQLQSERMTTNKLQMQLDDLSKQLAETENDLKMLNEDVRLGENMLRSVKPADANAPAVVPSGCLPFDMFHELKLGEVYELCPSGTIVTFHEFVWKNQPHADGRLKGGNIRLYQGQEKELPGGYHGLLGKIDSEVASVKFWKK